MLVITLLSLGPFNALAFRFVYFHLVFSVLYLDPADPRYLDEKEELLEHYMRVIMIQSCFKYILQPLSNTQILKYRHLFTSWPKHIPVATVAFIPLLNEKLDITS